MPFPLCSVPTTSFSLNPCLFIRQDQNNSIHASLSGKTKKFNPCLFVRQDQKNSIHASLSGKTKKFQCMPHCQARPTKDFIHTSLSERTKNVDSCLFIRQDQKKLVHASLSGRTKKLDACLFVTEYQKNTRWLFTALFATWPGFEDIRWRICLLFPSSVCFCSRSTDL